MIEIIQNKIAIPLENGNYIYNNDIVRLYNHHGYLVEKVVNKAKNNIRFYNKIPQYSNIKDICHPTRVFFSNDENSSIRKYEITFTNNDDYILSFEQTIIINTPSRTIFTISFLENDFLHTSNVNSLEGMKLFQREYPLAAIYYEKYMKDKLFSNYFRDALIMI